MRYFAGGDQTLRGFSYKSQSTRNSKDELLGSKYMSCATAEFEFPIGISNSRGAVFLDSAIVTNDYKEDHHLLYGPGIGYRYITPYGIAKIDIAYGIDNHRDKHGVRLHLQFGPEF
jgi:translocation and assembly module TamA